jgi:lipopolysaccharide biosynthesis glycosyltransferase
LLQFAVSRHWTWHDMDILNSLCDGKVTLCPLEWNFYDIGSRFDVLPDHWKKMYLDAKNKVKIVHFADSSKPWLNCHIMSYFELFWKYATRTPFIDIIIDRMKKKGYIQSEGISRYILHNIKHRQGIGLYLLLKGLFVWLFLRKNKTD